MNVCLQSRGMLIVSSLLLVASAGADAEDWPMLGRDITRNSVSLEKNPPTDWDIDTGRNIRWKASLGSMTHGTPVIADGKVQQVQIPQVPFGNEHTHFVLTVFYDMLFYGVRWSTIRKEYHQEHITEADVREFIRSRGRCVLRELGGSAYTVVNANPPTVDEIQNKEKEAAYV